MNKVGLAAVVALALASVPAQVQAQDVAAAVADSDRGDQARALDEARQPATVLEFADIQKGSTVVDFMSGNGYFAEMLSSLVGKKGTVYVVNPTAFHDPAVWEAHQARKSNFRLLVAAPKALALGPNSIDTIFTHLVFHDLFWESEQYNYPRLDVPSVLANWRAALKDGGTVVIIDHDGPEGDNRDVVQRLHRLNRDAAVAAMEAAGFRMVEESDALSNESDDLDVMVFDESVRGKTSRYMLKFQKN